MAMTDARISETRMHPTILKVNSTFARRRKANEGYETMPIMGPIGRKVLEDAHKLSPNSGSKVGGRAVLSI